MEQLPALGKASESAYGVAMDVGVVVGVVVGVGVGASCVLVPTSAMLWAQRSEQVSALGTASAMLWAWPGRRSVLGPAPAMHWARPSEQQPALSRALESAVGGPSEQLSALGQAPGSANEAAVAAVVAVEWS